MKIFKNVKSTAKVIPEVEVNVDTVYVRSDITDISDKDNPNLKNIGQEIQYKKDHFIESISEKNKQLEDENVELLFKSAINEMKTENMEKDISELIIKIAIMEGGLV